MQAYRRLSVVLISGFLVTACAGILGDFQEDAGPGGVAEGGDDSTTGGSDGPTGGDGRSPEGAPGEGGSLGEAGHDGTSGDAPVGDVGSRDAPANDGGADAVNGGDTGGGEAGGGADAKSDGGEAGPPLPVIDVLDFTLGGSHSCAVVSYTQPGDASAPTMRTYCWGANDRGQLGGGTVTPLPPDAGLPGAFAFVVPLTATSLARVVASPTSNHTCGTDGVGQVWCWGANDQGQVNGMANTPGANVATPARLTDSNTGNRLVATLLSVGANHACSADTSPADAGAPIFCWGANDHCQAGQADTNQNCTIAVKNVAPAPELASAGPVYALACGDNATLVVDQHFGTHPLLGFIGDSSYGQCDGQSIGDVVFETSCGNWGDLLPSAVSFGNEHGCAINSLDGGVAGEVDCWGANDSQQVDPSQTGGGHLGNTTAFTQFTDLPVAVGAGDGDSCAVFSAAGGAHYLACQGKNDHFQLATDTNGQSAGPLRINDGTGTAIDVTKVGMGSRHLCAMTRTAPHSLLCWGDNTLGQVGVAIVTNSKGTFDVQSPTRVAFPSQAQ